MSSHDLAPPEAESLTVVFLAAGFGTRIANDLQGNSQFSHLSSTPKPLLPIAGHPLISHWLPLLTEINYVTSTIIITNNVYYSQYRAWASQLASQYPDISSIKSITVLSNAIIDNDSRYGSIHDLHIALSYVARIKPQTGNAIVIAADTLLPGTSLKHHVQKFLSSSSLSVGVFAYLLTDMADCVNRGMLTVERAQNDTLIATGLVEKPTSPNLAPSPWATAPVYMLRRSIWGDLSKFLSERISGPIHSRDAPGLFLSWLLERERCLLLCIPSRVDIGRLSHYKDALYRYTRPPLPPPSPRIPDEPAVGRAFPRLGLLGNPSDIYCGRVVAVAIQSEGYAEVVASPSDTFSITRNPQFELPISFDGIHTFVESVQSRGMRYGAYQLVLAAALAFMRKYAAALHSDKSIHDALADLPNCRLSYTTSIPARIGLAGSSALVLATFHALARFFNKSLESIDDDIYVWPVLMRAVETDELHIECGLMDRVAQVMHGCVDMDFASGPPGRWTRIPYQFLPQLYIIYYRNDDGECSGTVHGSAKRRINVTNPAVQDLISGLAGGAEKLAKMLQAGKFSPDTDFSELPNLFDRNFELRCGLFGRDAIAHSNIKLIKTARDAGFGAKMSGSGGCAVCVPRPLHSLTEEEEKAAVAFFEKHEMVFRKVDILEPMEWRASAK